MLGIALNIKPGMPGLLPLLPILYAMSLKNTVYNYLKSFVLKKILSILIPLLIKKPQLSWCISSG